MKNSKNSNFGHHPISIKNQPLRTINEQPGHHPVVEAEIDGIHMGVMLDGTPFIGLRGLSRLTGIDHAPLLRFANNWGEEVSKPRGKTIYDLLVKQGHPGDLLYTRIVGIYGEAYAFPDAVSMAILEYYAFEAGRYCTEQAKDNYRLLARKSFRDFIYEKCGYSPENAVQDSWKPFHDRLSATYNSVPSGYFSVFHQSAELFIGLGREGIHTDAGFLPDISIGIRWGKHWETIKGDDVFGKRIKYPHNYPSNYPQALSNPQEPWAYPEEAMGKFNKWLRENYVSGGGLQQYLKGSKKIPVEFAEKALIAIQAKYPPQISKN